MKLSASAARKLGIKLPPGKNKYGARAVTHDGVRFASMKEGKRYLVLKAMERAGEIADLECHPVFPLIVNGVLCGRYTGDFSYQWGQRRVIEDVKGGKATRTEAYRLRKRIVEAIYGIKIIEV